MNLKSIILSILVLIFVTGCAIDPYKNHKYGEQTIDAWFSYKTEEVDFGKVRRKVENIQSIESKTCKYKEKYNNYYIFTCKVEYKEVGVTIIPLSETKTKDFYVAFMPDGTSFKYKVYNSSSEDNIWKSDKELK